MSKVKIQVKLGAGMKQHEAVVEAMRINGGYATLGRLYQDTLKISGVIWGTKTPTATIRRIVQERPEFYRIKPGLWALVESRDSKRDNLLLNEDLPDSTHTDYQGLLVEIGNWKYKGTFIPAQDKNQYSLLLQSKLADLSSVKTIYQFTYPSIVDRTRTIDVVWFNERLLPDSLFEVEHSTDMQNAMGKFVQLQDFNVKFYIVADKTRENLFRKTLTYFAFDTIRTRVTFLSYDKLLDLHTATSKQYLIEHELGL